MKHVALREIYADREAATKDSLQIYREIGVVVKSRTVSL
jgi:hypothetical protein